MDRRTEWPWSWEEEAEWKADLQERGNGFLEELIDDTVEDVSTDSLYDVAPSQSLEQTGDSTPEKYLVTA